MKSKKLCRKKRSTRKNIKKATCRCNCNKCRCKCKINHKMCLHCQMRGG